MTLHQVMNDDVLKVHMQEYGLYSEKENDSRILINTEGDEFENFYLERIQEYSSNFRSSSTYKSSGTLGTSLYTSSQITALSESTINLNRGANAPA